MKEQTGRKDMGKRINKWWIMISAVGFFAALFVIFLYVGDWVYQWKHFEMSTTQFRFYLVAALTLVLILFVCMFCLYCIPTIRLNQVLDEMKKLNQEERIGLEVNVWNIDKSIQKIVKELQNSLMREHSEIVLRQQSQYAQLQSQINPHFLYNTLETIRGQAMIDDNYVIADMTEALAKYFRYNISKENDVVNLSDEIENIWNYIHIQQFRFRDKFLFHVYNHDESGQLLQCRIPKMTLQPIVENAISHGVEDKIEQGNISIHLEMTKERLIIKVADDGVGMTEETLEKLRRKLKKPLHVIKEEKSEKSKHNGIAMENINSRLNLLYGTDYGIEVSSTFGYGTEVELTLPMMIEQAENVE